MKPTLKNPLKAYKKSMTTWNFFIGALKLSEKKLFKGVIAKNLQGKIKAEFVRNKGHKGIDLDKAIKLIWDCKRYVTVKTEINVTKMKQKSKINIMIKRSQNQATKIFVINMKLINGLNALITRIVQITMLTNERRKNQKRIWVRERNLHINWIKTKPCHQTKIRLCNNSQITKSLHFRAQFYWRHDELNDEFEGSEGQNNPEVFMLNQHEVRSAFDHLEVIVGILIEPGSCQMIALHGLVDSCLTGTVIHPTVLKHINYKIEQEDESEWKTAAEIMWTSKCLKIEKAMLPSIMVSWWFYFPQALDIIPNTK